MPAIKLVLLDIEGTTTSISFIADVLFPFIRKHVQSFLDKNWDTAQSHIEALRKLAEEDVASGKSVTVIPSEGGKEAVLAAVVKNIFEQMDQDRKSTALKALQGQIWLSGYESGELLGDIYDDAYDAFMKWKSLNIPIAIYSSGSIAAQKLLFKHTNRGDLTPMIVDYFDTTIGMKVEASSYTNILNILAKSHSVTASDILFVTDNIKEAIAADEVGMSTILSIRPGTAQLPSDHKFLTLTTFDSIFEHFQF